MQLLRLVDSILCTVFEVDPVLKTPGKQEKQEKQGRKTHPKSLSH